MSIDDVLHGLHAGLRGRPMPEDVASSALRIGALESDPVVGPLLRSVAGARRHPHSFMPSSWFKPVGCATQIATARGLFEAWLADQRSDPAAATQPSESDPARLSAFASLLGRSLGRGPGPSGFKEGRLLGEDRLRAFQPYRAKNAYNKRFRFVARFEAKVATFAKEMRLVDAREGGKGGLVADLPSGDFSSSVPCAAFIAYFAARKARRSLFTDQSQDRPFDELAEALLRRALEDPGTNVMALARVHPHRDVCDRLADRERGRLLGMWTQQLVSLADDLRLVWEKSEIDLESMVVRRGNDSTTWNLLAQAWNTSRNAWMALLTSTGQEGLLEAACPGKVLRLIAADVAHWHRSGGGDLQPDTKVWRILPKPWEVLRGEAECTLSTVEAACREAGRVRPGGSRGACRPTPFRSGRPPISCMGLRCPRPISPSS